MSALVAESTTPNVKQLIAIAERADMEQETVPEIRTLRIKADFATMAEAAAHYDMVYRTWQDWELYDKRSPAKELIIKLLKRRIAQRKEREANAG